MSADLDGMTYPQPSDSPDGPGAFLALIQDLSTQKTALTGADTALDGRLDALEAGAGRGAAIHNPNSLAALNTLAGGVTMNQGELASTNGNIATGIQRVVWVKNTSSIVVPYAALTATTKSDMDTFITAVNALANVTFRSGILWTDLSTGFIYRFTSSAGVYVLHSTPWTDYTPGSSVGFALGTGGTRDYAKYRVSEGHCFVELGYTFGSGSPTMTDPQVGVPSAVAIASWVPDFFPAGEVNYTDVSTGNRFRGPVAVLTGTSVMKAMAYQVTTPGQAISASAATIFGAALATGDKMVISTKIPVT